MHPNHNVRISSSCIQRGNARQLRSTASTGGILLLSTFVGLMLFSSTPAEASMVHCTDHSPHSVFANNQSSAAVSFVTILVSPTGGSPSLLALNGSEILTRPLATRLSAPTVLAGPFDGVSDLVSHKYIGEAYIIAVGLIYKVSLSSFGVIVDRPSWRSTGAKIYPDLGNHLLVTDLTCIYKLSTAYQNNQSVLAGNCTHGGMVDGPGNRTARMTRLDSIATVGILNWNLTALFVDNGRLRKWHNNVVTTIAVLQGVNGVTNGAFSIPSSQMSSLTAVDLTMEGASRRRSIPAFAFVANDNCLLYAYSAIDSEWVEYPQTIRNGICGNASSSSTTVATQHQLYLARYPDTDGFIALGGGGQMAKLDGCRWANISSVTGAGSISGLPAGSSPASTSPTSSSEMGDQSDSIHNAAGELPGIDFLRPSWVIPTKLAMLFSFIFVGAFVMGFLMRRELRRKNHARMAMMSQWHDNGGEMHSVHIAMDADDEESDALVATLGHTPIPPTDPRKQTPVSPDENRPRPLRRAKEEQPFKQHSLAGSQLKDSYDSLRYGGRDELDVDMDPDEAAAHIALAPAFPLTTSTRPEEERLSDTELAKLQGPHFTIGSTINPSINADHPITQYGVGSAFLAPDPTLQDVKSNQASSSGNSSSAGGIASSPSSPKSPVFAPAQAKHPGKSIPTARLSGPKEPTLSLLRVTADRTSLDSKQSDASDAKEEISTPSLSPASPPLPLPNTGGNSPTHSSIGSPESTVRVLKRKPGSKPSKPDIPLQMLEPPIERKPLAPRQPTRLDPQVRQRRLELMKNGKYSILKMLGKGSNGTVFSILLDDGTCVAMKEMPLRIKEENDATKGEEILEEEAIERAKEVVLREVEVLKSVEHVNIVEFYHVSFNVAERLACVYMELVTGGSLATMVRGMRVPLPEAVAKKYVVQLVEALVHIHAAGVIHRDLKCDNVLLTVEGTVKLADFGTAKLLGHTLARCSGSKGAKSVVGSPHHMAPEVIKADDFIRYGPKADVWSLGITVSELLSKGVTPWPPFSNPGQAFLHIGKAGVLPDFPSHLSPVCLDFVRSCCIRAPTDRPSAAELLSHPWLKQ